MEPKPLYMTNLSPVATPADREANLELENSTLRMRVAVLTEALRAAEEELTAHRFGECEWASSGVVLSPVYALAKLAADKREFGS
jgi:hypothetical protein